MSANRFFKLLLIIIITIFNTSDSIAQNRSEPIQHIVPNRINGTDQLEKPYVILISSDGFRHDYIDKYNAQNLKKLSENGVRASSLIPSFPSLTFPNHYTIATGLYPAHHGIVNNNFLDKKRGVKYSPGDKEKVRDGYFYGGTPLWVLAENQKMLSATYYWIGSEAPIQGIKSTYSYDYIEGVSIDSRIQTIIEWLNLPAEKRPHLITFYINEPDHSGHNHGPESDEVAVSVKLIDEAVYKLTKAVEKTGLPVNFILVSDHGMTAIDQNHFLKLTDLDLEKVQVTSTGAITDLHVEQEKNIQQIYTDLKKNAKDYRIYLKKDIPKHLNYNSQEDKFNRIGDIILMAKWPKVFSVNEPKPGYHGYDPSIVKDMHGIFMAWGPAFKENIKIKAFENIHLYPMIAEVLGLKINETIDGDINILKPILKD